LPEDRNYRNSDSKGYFNSTQQRHKVLPDSTQAHRSELDETPKALQKRQPVVEDLEDEDVTISPSKTDKLRKG
jgi:hypothetical protein